MPDLSAVQRPIADLPIAAKIDIPGSPDWVGIGTDAVWISNANKDSLARLNPSTNTVTKIVAVGRGPWRASPLDLTPSGRPVAKTTALIA